MKIITWTKRLLLTLTFLALIATNILTLTSTAFNAALSGLVGTALGTRTVSSMMQSKLAGQDKAIKKHQSTATVQCVPQVEEHGARGHNRLRQPVVVRCARLRVTAANRIFVAAQHNAGRTIFHCEFIQCPHCIDLQLHTG